MDQKGLMFVPHIMVVQLGTTVVFHNSDSVAHNIFWPSINGNKKLSHNMGTWPQGEKSQLQIRQPGRSPAAVQCPSRYVGLHHRVADALLCEDR